VRVATPSASKVLDTTFKTSGEIAAADAS
jgi:hypothetical protein